MNHQTVVAKIRLLILVLIGLLFCGYFASCAWLNKKPKMYFPDDAQTVGIIDPDGIQSVWLVPDYESREMFQELARHPIMIVEGIQFYKISTWQDTAAALAAMGRRREIWIQVLVEDIQRLSQINRAYEINSRPKADALSERVRVLEEQVKQMTDSGHQ